MTVFMPCALKRSARERRNVTNVPITRPFHIILDETIFSKSKPNLSERGYKEAVMDGPKILEVIEGYRKHFIEKGIGVMDFPEDALPGSEQEILAHCHGMLAKMEGFVREGRIEKAFRWLGFVQGCLWSTGQYSLEDLKNHNRPAE